MTNTTLVNRLPMVEVIGNAINKAWDFAVRWTIVAILSGVCFTLYTRNVELTGQLATAVAAQKACEERLSKALIPETSVGEFANNRIWQPTKNAVTSAYTWVSDKIAAK